MDNTSAAQTTSNVSSYVTIDGMFGSQCYQIATGTGLVITDNTISSIPSRPPPPLMAFWDEATAELRAALETAHSEGRSLIRALHEALNEAARREREDLETAVRELAEIAQGVIGEPAGP